MATKYYWEKKADYRTACEKVVGEFAKEKSKCARKGNEIKNKSAYRWKKTVVIRFAIISRLELTG